MSLWIVRHAVPLIAPGSCYGQLDVPADAALTESAALAVAQVLPIGARLRYSPLQRCERLMQALCALRPDLALDCQPDPRLMEMGFGTHEGKLWADISAQQMAAWTDDFAHHAFGGGETVAGFMGRVAAAWDAYRSNTGDHEVWISHAGVARAAQLLSEGTRTIAHASEWPVAGPAFGEWVCL